MARSHSSGVKGRTKFHRVVAGRVKGNGMGGKRRGINPKMHRVKNRGHGR